MKPLRFTLVTDGSSDEVLLHPVRWLLLDLGANCPIEANWADLRGLPTRSTALKDRIKDALRLYPCELLFVHRDAEREAREVRTSEIRRTLEELAPESGSVFRCPHACVVPVRMTEAWLIFEEAAIRAAAGNPSGRSPLPLPQFSKLESLVDPKATLENLLLQATELPSRRLRNFRVPQAIRRVAELITDFSPLNELPAFAALRKELEGILRAHRWS